MASPVVLLGAVLTFGSSDASRLTLTVSLTESATLALDYNGIPRSSDVPSTRHTFTGLPTPRFSPAPYRVRGPNGILIERTIKPIPVDGPLDLALYGDSRGGAGPHRRIAQTIAEFGPNILVHTGDVVQRAGDTEGWVQHLAAALPASSASPIIYALGNHELWQDWRKPKTERIDAYAAVMAEVPPPDDPIAKDLGVHPGVYHVRVGTTLFIALDSNRPIDPTQTQGKFLERVLKEHSDAKFKFIVLHHGPLSSGRHGGNIYGSYMMYVAEENGVTAFLAGHDHTYERIVQKGVTVVVSGGGGAPLYQRGGSVVGSRAFVSTYNWVKIQLGEETGTLEAYSLEGALLDRGSLPDDEMDLPDGRTARTAAIAGLALLLLGFGFVTYRLVFRTGR